MRVNLCVNGSFRYPQYVRHLDEAGVLGRFSYAHRRSTTASAMGLSSADTQNLWFKEYALQAACRLLPTTAAAHAEEVLCDLWQSAVIRRWRDCDSVEAVIGAVADRVLALAKQRGSRTVGHPVCAHPDAVSALVGRAYRDLGLDPGRAIPSAPDRRRREIDLCDRLLVDSRFVARSFEEAGFPRDRIVTLSPGVDLARFHPRTPADLDRTVFRVVCVGTVTPRKAQHILLQAWRQLRLPRAELILVGPAGRDASAVARGHDGHFVHHRRIANAALRDLLVRASVFVLPSVEDGFGQAPVEAMACGVPVIVTRNVGMADLMTDGEEGFIVEPFDAEPIAARLESLYRNSKLAADMGVAAARTAHRVGSWKSYADRVVALHRALLAKPADAAEAA